MAQTFTAFPDQLWAAGEHDSNFVNYNGHGVIVEFQITSATWATDDPSIVVRVAGQQSFDSGVTWQDVAAYTVSPGPLMDKQGNPTTPRGAFDVNDTLGPRRVRAQIVPSAPLTFGLSGNTT